jgi:two-component system, OmpR family, response regulator
MPKEKKINISIVDDDVLFLKSLEIEFLQHPGFVVETFSSGELCLANLKNNPDVIILDYHLDGINKHAMNGLDTLDKIKTWNANIPVILLSSQDKIEVAVDCMHHKAFDYIVKGDTAFQRLLINIANIVRYKEVERTLNWYMERM